MSVRSPSEAAYYELALLQVGVNLREWRISYDMTQADVSRLISARVNEGRAMSETYYRMVESGQKSVSLSRLLLITDVMHMPPSETLYGIRSMRDVLSSIKESG